MSLRWRLTLWYSGLLAVVLAVALALAYVIHAESHDSDVDAALNDMAAHATSEIDGQVTRGVPLAEVALGQLHRVIDEPYAAWLVVGTATVASAGATDDRLLSALDVVSVDDGWHTTWTEDGRMRLLSAPVAAPGARLVLAADLTAVDAANAQLRWAYFMLGLVTVGVGAGVSSELAASALRPVTKVTDTAREIAASRDFGRRVGIAGDPEDELVAMAATFDEMLASLDGAYRRQLSFLGDMSHELRTPLAVIHGNAELLTAGEDDVAARQLASSQILRESERLTRLVDKLLVLARADAAEPLTGRPVALHEVVMEVFEELRSLAGDRLRIRWIDPITVSGERDRLKQLLVVLVDNALRYTPAPGAVVLSLSDDGEDAVLRVEDEGIGLPNVPAERLFERSYRGEAARALDPSGSGLGLSIALWIAERHGGSILIEPNEPRGTRVSVRLPHSQR